MLPSYCGSLREILTQPFNGKPQLPASRGHLLQFVAHLVEQARYDLREIANFLGMPGCVINYSINALLDKVWVKVHNLSESKDKFGYIYLLTPRGIAEKAAITRRFLKRKLLEYEAMWVEIESLNGGLYSGAVLHSTYEISMSITSIVEGRE